MKTDKEDAVQETENLEFALAGYANGSLTFEEWRHSLQVTPETMLEIIRNIHERNPAAIDLWVLTVRLEGSDGKMHDLKKVEDIKPGSNRRVRFGFSPLRPYSPNIMEVD
jgi:hypothetical protein